MQINFSRKNIKLFIKFFEIQPSDIDEIVWTDLKSLLCNLLLRFNIFSYNSISYKIQYLYEIYLQF